METRNQIQEMSELDRIRERCDVGLNLKKKRVTMEVSTLACHIAVMLDRAKRNGVDEKELQYIKNSISWALYQTTNSKARDHQETFQRLVELYRD